MIYHVISAAAGYCIEEGIAAVNDYLPDFGDYQHPGGGEGHGPDFILDVIGPNIISRSCVWYSTTMALIWDISV